METMGLANPDSDRDAVDAPPAFSGDIGPFRITHDEGGTFLALFQSFDSNLLLAPINTDFDTVSIAVSTPTPMSPLALASSEAPATTSQPSPTPAPTPTEGRHGHGGGGRVRKTRYHWYASRYLCALTLLVVLIYSIKHFTHVVTRSHIVRRLRKAREEKSTISPAQSTAPIQSQPSLSPESASPSHQAAQTPLLDPASLNHPSPKSVISRAHAASSSATQTYLYLRNFPRWLYGPDTVADAICTIIYCGILFFYSLNNTEWVGGDQNAPNQMGVMAFSQLPLILLLITKNNPISSLTGITYQKLNYLHRASSRACLLLSWVHAIAWTPAVWEAGHFSHMYIITGLAALFGFTLLWVTSFRVIRRVAYEFFIVSHIVFTLVFLIGAIFHWEYLSYWVWPSLAIWLLDRAVRFLRLAIQNKSYFTKISSPSLFRSRFRSRTRGKHRFGLTLGPHTDEGSGHDNDAESAVSFDMSAPNGVGGAVGADAGQEGSGEDELDNEDREEGRRKGGAKIELVDEDLIRITAKVGFTWGAGQHAFISAPTVQSSFHESHPFSIANTPDSHDGLAIFLIRVHSGFTLRLRDALPGTVTTSIPILVEGPYGATHSIPTTLPSPHPSGLPSTSVLLLAGGTGVTFTSSHLLALMHDACVAPTCPPTAAAAALKSVCGGRPSRIGRSSRSKVASAGAGVGVGVKRIRLVWHVRRIECVSWLSGVLNAAAEMQSAAPTDGLRLDLRVEIYVTRAHVADEPAPEPSLAQVVMQDLAAEGRVRTFSFLSQRSRQSRRSRGSHGSTRPLIVQDVGEEGLGSRWAEVIEEEEGSGLGSGSGSGSGGSSGMSTPPSSAQVTEHPDSTGSADRERAKLDRFEGNGYDVNHDDEHDDGDEEEEHEDETDTSPLLRTTRLDGGDEATTGLTLTDPTPRRRSRVRAHGQGVQGHPRRPRPIAGPTNPASLGLTPAAAGLVDWYAGRADLTTVMVNDLADSAQLSVAVCGPIELIRAAREAVKSVDTPQAAWKGQGRIEYFEETLGV